MKVVMDDDNGCFDMTAWRRKKREDTYIKYYEYSE